MNTLNHLLSPIKIRTMELPNRAVMPPMGTNLASESMVSEANLAYIKRQAKGGAGLIILEVTAVHPSGSVGGGHLGIYDDKYLPGLKRIADAVHDEGSRAAVQLHHTGRENVFLLQKGEAIAPSAIPSVVFRMTPREMTIDEIHEIIDSFGRAAIRAREAGFDAVEVHGAHGYLLAQFLSANSNHRSDEYGGSFKNRGRFTIEVLESVRKAVGDDFPVSIRVSAEEFIKNGYTVEDILTVLPDFVRAGADIIHASIGTHGSPGGITSAPPEYEQGFNVWCAKKIKEAVDAPVIAVGRFTDPEFADEVIARGDADMVAFGRQQLADPDYLFKARNGHADDIRKCIACNQGCIERLMTEPGSSVRCAINPETGQELIYPLNPAKEKRNVWVIGSGPAGLTAAFEAKRLGHKVTLFEKNEKAGGQLLYARLAPFKQVYGEWIAWFISQVEKAGVQIKTNTCVTDKMLDEGEPEVVILATGGEKIIPDIEGTNLPLACDAWQLLDGTVEPGKNAVVIGGGLVGMEAADFLIDKGCEVTLVEMLERSPVRKITAHGYMIHKRLRDGGCRLLFGTEIESIHEDSVKIISGGKRDVISSIDQVVIAVGLKPGDQLKKKLREKGIRHYIVGDASQVRRIIDATEEGARAAWDV